MASHQIHKRVLNSVGVDRRIELFLHASANVGKDDNQPRSPGAVTPIRRFERRSIFNRLAPYGGSIAALTAAALIAGSLKGGWVSAAILGLIAFGQCVAVLAPYRPAANFPRIP